MAQEYADCPCHMEGHAHLNAAMLNTLERCWLQVVELYKAADKYEVLGLVLECVTVFRTLTGAAEVAPLLEVCPSYQ